MTLHPPAGPPQGDDPTLGRAVAALRHLPEVPPGAVDRVVAVALARNGVPGRRSVAASWLARAAVLVLAAGLGAVTATWATGRGRAAPEVVAAANAPTSTAADSVTAPPAYATRSTPYETTVAGSGIARHAAIEAEERPVPTAFVLARRAAHRVAVVGDFNGWNPAANVMTSDARGVWSATVALPPGRHAYAFVVDGATWVTDPRAPVVRDADYGRDQSVVVVAHP